MQNFSTIHILSNLIACNCALVHPWPELMFAKRISVYMAKNKYRGEIAFVILWKCRLCGINFSEQISVKHLTVQPHGDRWKPNYFEHRLGTNRRKEFNAASAIIQLYIIVCIRIHYPDLFVNIGKASKWLTRSAEVTSSEVTSEFVFLSLGFPSIGWTEPTEPTDSVIGSRTRALASRSSTLRINRRIRHYDLSPAIHFVPHIPFFAYQ